MTLGITDKLEILQKTDFKLKYTMCYINGFICSNHNKYFKFKCADMNKILPSCFDLIVIIVRSITTIISPQGCY